MNIVAITGRLVRDPEMRYTTSGKAVVNFTVAVDRYTATDKNAADFINCVAWDKQADVINNHFSKGNRIGITGNIKTGSYEKADGTKVYTTDVSVTNIDFLETKQEAAQSASNGPNQTNGSQQQKQKEYNEDPFSQSGEPLTINDDDLPF